MAFEPDAPAAGGFVPDAPPMTPKEKGVQGLSESRSGEQFMDVPRAMVQNTGAKVAGGFAGMAGALLPGPQGQGANWAQKTEEALSFEPKNPNSQIGLKAAGLPFEYLVEKPSHALGSKIGEKYPLAGALTEGALQAAPLALGLRGGKPSITPKQQGAIDAQASGFKLTPTDADAGMIPRALEGLSGEPKLAKNISGKNAAVATEKMSAEFGLPKGAPLDIETLRDIRKQAGGNYEAVRNTGQVTASPEYGVALDKLAAKYANAQKDFPELARNDVLAVTDGARKASFNASSAVDLIGQMRESADQAFAGRNTGLGKVYRGVADALENELERHTAALGQPELLNQFKEGRTTIAKTYLAEKALNGGETINPQIYAKALAKGKPLSGAGLEIGEAATANPRSFQKPAGGNQGSPTWSDAILGGVSGIGGALVARPVGRAILSSEPYQRVQNQPQAIAGPALMKALQAGTLSVPPPQRNQ